MGIATGGRGACEGELPRRPLLGSAWSGVEGPLIELGRSVTIVDENDRGAKAWGVVVERGPVHGKSA